MLVFLILILWVAPMLVGINICNKRNRNWVKGLFVTFFFGWAGAIGLWLALKRRNPETNQFY